MNHIRLSLIAPFYNVEPYLAKFLNSMLEQDIPESEYEIICVNDCSPDNSREIVLSYQKNHSNIILIEHSINKKVGGAFNTAIETARGKYVWLLGSDDWIKPNCIGSLLTICEKDSLDVLAFNYAVVDDSDNILHVGLSFQNSEITDGFSFVHKYFEGDNIRYHLLGYAVRALYKTDFLKSKNIIWSEGVYFQDTVYFIQTILAADKIRSLNNYYYYYRKNINSISQFFSRELKGDLIYGFAFQAGGELYKFADSVYILDKKISENLKIQAIWYYNSFVLRLIKAPITEKIKFYKLLEENKDFVNEKIKMTSCLAKILANQYFGFCIAVSLKPIYLLKKKLL